MKIIQNIKKYIDYKHISLHAFEKSISASTGSIGKLIKNDGSIGGDFIQTISKVYSDLNLNWLITGEGEMLKEVKIENGNIKIKQEHNGNGHNILNGNDELKHKLEMLEKEIESLRNEVLELKKDKEFLQGLLSRK